MSFGIFLWILFFNSRSYVSEKIFSPIDIPFFPVFIPSFVELSLFLEFSLLCDPTFLII